MKREKPLLFIQKKDIKKLLEQGISEGVFASAAVGIVTGTGKEKKETIAYCGNATLYPEKRRIKKNNYFDLASLTKPLATTLAILSLIKEKKISVDENLSSLLEKKIKGKKNKITARNLLSHEAGFPAYREYFKVLKEGIREEKIRYVENLILKEKLEHDPGSKVLYSDLGFILLGIIIEKKAGCPQDKYVEEKVFKPLKLEKKIFYKPLYQEKKIFRNTDFVATENCSWRKKTICGEVHDENCYVMGGVAGHSGLFGNIEGMTAYAGTILDMWKGIAVHPNINNEEMVAFLARQQHIPGSTWALGFDTPSTKESSSGSFLSQNSVGHLGFTGTSFWIDPEKDVAIVLLSNRVHPNRQNIKIKQFRPYFHDRVLEKLFPPAK